MKRFLLSAGFVLLAVQAQAAFLWGNSYYQWVEAPGITWDDANAAANASTYNGYAGHLVTLNTPAENAWVKSKFTDLGITWEYWAGGFQPAGESNPAANWTWVNGEGMISFFDWGTNEPNDWYGPGTEQHLGINYFGLWNDEGGPGNVGGYVIEYGPVPEPTTLLAGALLLAPLGLGMVRKARKP